MRLVEQATFTAIESGAAGYQVVAQSPGVSPADARELAAWGPTHDSILDPGDDAASLNFHPLPSGDYCVSRPVRTGWGGRSSPRACTHCLLLPAEVLVRFGNNPFAVIDAASNRGLWRAAHPPYGPLGPLALSGGASVVDQTLLESLASDPGAAAIAALLQAARDSACLALAGASRAAALMAGLFSCLPAECRLEFSFSTGLKFSPRRPFRMVVLSDDPAQRQWIASYPNVTLLELGGGRPTDTRSFDGWSRLVHQSLSGRHTAFLAAQVSKRRFHLTPCELPALGLQLLEELDCLELGGVAGPTGSPNGQRGAATVPSDGQQPPSVGMAHAAHRRFAKSESNSPAAIAPIGSSGPLDPQSPEVLDRLEQLDDMVYEAINGDSAAMQRLETAWPKVTAELGDETLAQSREQYLRYALSVWDQCVGPDGLRQPDRAIQAVDVLCLLFGDAN